MKLMNCSSCGRLQMGHSQTLCKDCFRKYVDMRQQVKAYLQANPSASVIDVCRQTGFSLKLVNEVVRQRA